MSQKHQQGYMPWDRTKLAKNKPTNYDIPDQQFVYGKLTYEDPEHANDMMYKWKNHEISKNHNHLKEKDMIETNKQCLKQLLSTSAQFSAHRKNNTLFKKAKEGNNVIKISLPEDSHAYGKPLELEDPVKLVIANNYGEDDLFARHTFYQKQTEQSMKPTRKLSCHITKNHNLLKEATARRLEKFNWNKKDDYWKLNKFQDVNFKVETRRPRLNSIK